MVGRTGLLCLVCIFTLAACGGGSKSSADTGNDAGGDASVDVLIGQDGDGTTTDDAGDLAADLEDASLPTDGVDAAVDTLDDAQPSDTTSDAQDDATSDAYVPQGCSKDEDCPGLQVCGNTKLCESSNACFSKLDCVPGFSCVVGVCVKDSEIPQGYCTKDEECENNGVCDPVSNTCADRQNCVTDDDCAGDRHCRKILGADTGSCVECYLGPHCSSGICNADNHCGSKPACASDSDCGTGLECKATGECETTPECKLCPNGAQDCNSGICDAGTCKTVSGVCEKILVCKTCTTGTECASGVCDTVCQEKTCQIPVSDFDAFEENDDQFSVKNLPAGKTSNLTLPINGCETNGQGSCKSCTKNNDCKSLQCGDCSPQPCTAPGTCVKPKDQDWFTITVPANKSLIVNAQYSSASGEIRIFLFPAIGPPVSQTVGSNGFAQVQFGGSSQQVELRLRVELYSGHIGTYSLEVLFADKLFCKADALEGSNGNDTPELATKINGIFETLLKSDYNFQQQLNATICAGDVDWYKIDVPPGANQLKVTLAYSTVQDDLQLDVITDPQGEAKVVGTATRQGDVIFVTVNNTVAETYYLRVRGVNAEARNSYVLTTLWNWTCVDAEGNDKAGAATILSSAVSTCFDGDLSTCRYLCDSNDAADWYQISVPANESLTIKVRYANRDPLVPLVVRLFDSDGTTELDVDAGTNQPLGVVTQAVTLTDAGPSGKTVYVEITRANGTGVAYVYDVNFAQGDPTCTDDPFEDEDDTIATAPVLPFWPFNPRSAVYCKDDPGDHMKVVIAPGTTYIADLLFDTAGAPLTLSLVDAQGNTKATSESFAHGLKMTYSADAIGKDGTFYVKITGTQSLSYNLYTFMKEASSCVGLPDDDDEDNDTLDEAKLLVGSSTEPAVRVLCGRDHDWYKMVLTNGQSGQIKLKSFTGSFEGAVMMSVSKVRANGSVDSVADTLTSSNVPQVTVNFTANEDAVYYFQLTDPTGSKTIKYELEWSVTQ